MLFTVYHSLPKTAQDIKRKVVLKLGHKNFSYHMSIFTQNVFPLVLKILTGI